MSSFNSIINKINNNYNKPKTLPLKRDIRKSAIYSTEFARNVIKIAQCKTIKQCEELSIESFDNVRAYEWLIRDTNKDFQERRIRINKMKRYSIEAANYLYSLEEENKVMEWFKSVLQFFKNLWEKFTTWLMSKVKGFQLLFDRIRANFTNGIYKKFKAENFQNVNAQINVLPVAKDITGDFENQIGTDKYASAWESWIEEAKKMVEKIQNANDDQLDEVINSISNLQKKGDALENSEMSLNAYIKKVNKEFFGTEERPKRITTTVGEYLDCKAGETPKKLELISEASLKNFKNNQKFYTKILTWLKNLSTLLSMSSWFTGKFAAKTHDQKELCKEAVKVFNKLKIGLNNMAQGLVYESSHALRIRQDIAKAISIGLKKPSSN